MNINIITLNMEIAWNERLLGQNIAALLHEAGNCKPNTIVHVPNVFQLLEMNGFIISHLKTMYSRRKNNLYFQRFRQSIFSMLSKLSSHLWHCLPHVEITNCLSFAHTGGSSSAWRCDKWIEIIDYYFKFVWKLSK